MSNFCLPVYMASFAQHFWHFLNSYGDKNQYYNLVTLVMLLLGSALALLSLILFLVGFFGRSF